MKNVPVVIAMMAMVIGTVTVQAIPPQFTPHVIKAPRSGAEGNTVPSMVWLHDVNVDGQVDVIASHVAWMDTPGFVVNSADIQISCPAWEPQDIPLTAERDYPWWSFPVRAAFVHRDSGSTIELEGFWDGDKNWVIRFAAPHPGIWVYTTSSIDRGLNGHRGVLTVSPPTHDQIGRNPNYRGHIRISDNGRFFQNADGTPFLLLADTLWAANTARCGLGDHQDGPFFQYLADRCNKGFNTVLIRNRS